MNKTLIGFIKKELIQTLRDPRMRVLLFIMPVVQLTLFGVALSNEVKNIRLAAVFDSKDTVLRDVYERSIAGKWFIPAKSRERDPFTMIEADAADAFREAQRHGFGKDRG